MNRGVSALSPSASLIFRTGLVEVAIEINERIGRPQVFVQLLPSDDLPGALEQ